MRKGRNTNARENGESSQRKKRSHAKENGKNIRGNSAKGSLVAGKSHSVLLRENSVRRQEKIKKTSRKIPGKFLYSDNRSRIKFV